MLRDVATLAGIIDEEVHARIMNGFQEIPFKIPVPKGEDSIEETVLEVIKIDDHRLHMRNHIPQWDSSDKIERDYTGVLIFTNYRTLFVPELGFVRGVWESEIVHRACLSNFNNHIMNGTYIPDLDVVATQKKPGMFSKSTGEKIIITQRKGFVHQNSFTWTLKDMEVGTFSKISSALLKSDKTSESIWKETYTRAYKNLDPFGVIYKCRLL